MLQTHSHHLLLHHHLSLNQGCCIQLRTSCSFTTCRVLFVGCFSLSRRYVDQGGGKRKGAFAIYMEPWHADVFEFLDLRKNHGKEEARARDLFYGLWVNDLFMQRVEANEDWSLFCPNEAPGLADCWGDDFKIKYEQ